MVEIITTDGVSLDLARDSEFELTYDHPALEDDRIPSPYSTSIAFPATERNKSVFGFIPAMMLPPSVTEIPATLFVSGIPLMKGHLVYEGMEEGMLNYSFSTDDLSETWSKKLYETSIANVASYPPIVNKEATTKSIYGNPPADIDVKYQNWNWPSSSQYKRMPAVAVATLLAEIGELDTSRAGLPSGLAILGLYREAGASPTVPACLPDRTLLNLLTGIAKIFCCAVYKDGEGYCLRKITDIFQNPDIIDWDDKVSDVCSYSKEEAKGFRLAFADDSSEDTYNDSDIAEDIRSGAIHTVSNLRSMLDSEYVGEGYTAIKALTPGDIFSIKKISCTVSESGESHTFYDYLLDVIKHNSTPVNIGENPLDCSTDFHLVRCIPVIHRVDHRPWSSAHDWQSDVQMAPVLTAPVEGSDRDDKVYIGVLRNGQLVDHGVYGSDQAFLQDASANLAPGTIYGSRSLYLLSSWLQKDRQIITVQVALSVTEIVEFRQWKVVSIRNRRFLVKQLRVRLSATGSFPETEADLIAL